MKPIRFLLLSYIKIISWINLKIASALCFFLIFLMFIMMYEVFSRYYLDSPTLWVFETSKMLFGFIAIWGGGYALLMGDHINVDLFYSNWPPRFKAFMDCVNACLFFFFIFTLMYLVGTDAVRSVGNVEIANSTLGQPLYQWRVSLFFGLLFLALQMLSNLFRSVWYFLFKDELK